MGSNFFALQAANRRRSWLLVVAAVLLLGGLGFAAGYGLTADPALGLVYTFAGTGFASFGALGSYFQGDSLVLAASHARPVEAGERPQLENIMDELALAAGIPRPRLY